VRSTVLLPFLILLSLHSLAVHAQSSSVVVVKFDVNVDPGSQQLIYDAVSAATASGSSAIVIQMNTPGGLLLNTQQIISKIQQAQASGIKVYTFVEPSGWAASAGSYIAMSTDGIYMGDGSAIGSSTPIVVGGTDLEQNHTESFMISYMVSLAQSHGRNVTAAELMVTQDAAYTADQAVQNGIATAKANNLQQVLTELGLQGAQTIQVSPSAYDQLLSFLSDPTVDGFLILIGVIAILLDLYHASVILTIVGAISIALGFLGSQLIGAPVVALVVFAAAAALIFLEVKTGHGLSMLGGILVALFGIWLLAGSSYGYSPSPFGPLQYGIWGVTAAVVFLGSLYLIRLREAAMKRPKAVSTQRVVGREGYLTSDIVPPGFGTANIASEDWTVKSDTHLKKGQKVRAVSVEGTVVTVVGVEDGEKG
jgi:membrane-bound serine protease (ClpP class)